MAALSRKRIVALLCVVAVFLGGGAILWHKVVRHHFYARNFGVVEDGRIYRSGRFLPKVLEKLHDERDIRAIVDLGGFPPDSPEDLAEQAMAEQLGITRFEFRQRGDGTGDPNGYVEAVRIIADPANQPVIVHCAAGSERTSTTVMLYRYLEQGVPISESYAEAIAHDHDPDDRILMDYLIENLAVIEGSYRTGRRIVQDENGKWVLAPESVTMEDGAHSP